MSILFYVLVMTTTILVNDIFQVKPQLQPIESKA